MQTMFNSCVDLLNRCGEAAGSFAGPMFLQVAILTAVLLVVEFLLRNRVRAVVRYWLWLLVLLKLVLPVGLHSPASIAYWLPTVGPEARQPADTHTIAPSPSLAAEHAVVFERPPESPVESRATVEKTASNMRQSSHESYVSPSSSPPPIAALPAEPQSASLHLQGWLFGLWLLIALALFALVVKRALWVRRIVRQATSGPPEIDEQLQACMAEMRLAGRRVALKTTEMLGSPAICGIPKADLVAGCGWDVSDHSDLKNWLAVFNATTGDRLLRMGIADQRTPLDPSKKSAGRGRELPILCCALSPDGQTLAYGREFVHLVDVAGQTEISDKALECPHIEALKFSPDSRKVAIGTHDGRLLVWNWNSHDKPRSFEIPCDPRFGPYPVWAFDFSPDGSSLAVINGNHDFHNIYLFKAATGETRQIFQTPDGEDWGPRVVAFSPDGKLLASSKSYGRAGGGVALWEVATGRLLKQLEGLFGDAYFLAFSSDGRKLAASSEWDSTMCVWDVRTGESLGGAMATHLMHPTSIRFLPGDRQIVTAGVDETIRVWDLLGSRQERVMRHVRSPGVYNSGIRAMDCSPDGKYIVSSSSDDTVRLWESATGHEIYRLPGHGQLGGYRAVRFTPDSKQFASWGDDMHVYLWDVATGKAQQDFVARPRGLSFQSDGLGNPPFSGELPRGPELKAGVFSGDAATLNLLLDGLRRFSVTSGEELPTIEYQTSIVSQLAISPKASHLVLANWGRREASSQSGQVQPQHHSVELRSLPDGKLVKSIDADGVGPGPMAFSPDGRAIAMILVGSQSEPQQIQLCSFPDLTETARIDLPSRAWAIEFSHSGKLLAASISNSNVLVWDLEHLPKANKH